MLSGLYDKVIDKIFSTSGAAAALLLLTALGSALWAYMKLEQNKSVRDFFEFAFPKEVILHPSARADALFWITKRLIMPFLLIPAGMVFVGGMALGVRTLIWTVFGLDAPFFGDAPGPVMVVLFTFTMILAYDLSYYFYHMLQHRIPFLWELHKVHHSAEVMVGITKDRVHPLDDFMNRIWDGIIPGICFGLWMVIWADPVEASIFGINVYVMRNILMMDFVRHTHFKISFGKLDNYILSPHWHQLHHSVDPKHYDRNFGLMLSIWDRMFGTACVPEPDEDFKFGLMDRDVRDYQSLFGLWVLPLIKMGRVARGWFRPKSPARDTAANPPPSA